MNRSRYSDDQPFHDAPPSAGVAHSVARALGWFSVILGAAELLAPSRVERSAGIRNSRAVVRGFGVREAATGAGLLASRNPEPWVWARVAGDLADIAAVAAARPRRRRLFARHDVDRRTATLATLAAITAADLACAMALRRERGMRHERTRDWSGRSGFPRPAAEMRGALRHFEAPRDMRTPALLKAWT